ncbi:hypothetical protein GGR92_004687 [Spirosoma lacussanchae]|uniref:hypothetical protein n=1 Tax=Spirosoma lacussanchae TaxID=1884249 RepID=UPI001109A973|nr:hypothetical protein [Spirosoma lacussanchae]
MRIRFHLLTFFGCTLLTLGGGATLLAQVPANARLTRTYKASNTGDNPANATFAAPSEQVTSQLTYFDGLGKPVQQVSLAFLSRINSLGQLNHTLAIDRSEFFELHLQARQLILLFQPTGYDLWGFNKGGWVG